MNLIESLKTPVETAKREPKRWQCSYCGRQYCRLNRWLFMHMEKKHEGQIHKCKNIEPARKVWG